MKLTLYAVENIPHVNIHRGLQCVFKRNFLYIGHVYKTIIGKYLKLRVVNLDYLYVNDFSINIINKHKIKNH